MARSVRAAAPYYCRKLVLPAIAGCLPGMHPVSLTYLLNCLGYACLAFGIVHLWLELTEWRY